MKWFFALNQIANRFDDYAAMVKVAVYSAKTRTSLIPHCLYDGEPSPFTQWLEEQGVKVIRVRSRFADLLKEEADRRKVPGIYPIGSGAFLRVELVAQEGLFEPGERVLYTDCDVMFGKDPVPMLQEVKCEFFAAVPEADSGKDDYCNSGIMLMDVDSLKRTFDEFAAFTRDHLESYVMKSWDQDAYNEFYKGKWSTLPKEFNWRPYWGVSRDAVVVHFHGPKPMWHPDDVEQRPSGHLAVNGYPVYRAAWHRLLSEVEGKRRTSVLKRNLVYHLYPLKESIWRWNVAQMKSYLGAFNGAKFVVVARDQWTDHPDQVSGMVGNDAEILVVDNDPEVKEGSGLLGVLERLSGSSSTEATFFAHGKGVTLRDPVRIRKAMALVRALWFLNVGCIDLVNSLMSRFGGVGAFRKMLSLKKEASTWRYMEGFYWLANSFIFSKAWRQYEYGEGPQEFPATFVPYDQSFNLTKDQPYWDYMRQVPTYPEYEDWLTELVATELLQEKAV